MKNIKERIVEENRKLGIKTFFYNEKNNIQGYAQKNTIYLNELYEEDLEIANKHELLHFFEESRQFLAVKKMIFSIIDQKYLNILRDEYCEKYKGLYTREQIKEGILDNEIIIDIVVDPKRFKLDINEYISNAYQTIISRKENISLTQKGKRYLAIDVSKNISNRYSNLSKWDLIFVEHYYKNKPKPTGEDRYDKIKWDAGNARFDLSWNVMSDKFKIDINNNPYLERRYSELLLSNQAKGNIEELKEMKSDKEAYLKKMAREYRINLYNQYSDLAKVIRESEYEDSFKYLMLNEVLTKSYRYEKGNKIVDKRDNNKTILPLMLLNENILKYIHDNIEKYKNFSDLYFDALDNYNQIFLNDKTVAFSSNEKGYWIKFPKSKLGSDELKKNAQNLENLIRETPWCTRKETMHQLGHQGDFYVFVDNFGVPHIAVQMEGEHIGEVRGIKGLGDQEIEDEYRDVALNFLKENSSIQGANTWLQKEIRNQKLYEGILKINSNNISDEELKILINNLNLNENRVHGGVNSNELKLINLLSENKELRDRVASIGDSASKVLFIIDEIERNSRILNYIDKLEKDILTDEDCSRMYEDVLYEFKNYNYDENQKKLIKIVNSKDNAFKKIIADKIGCKQSEIYVGELKMNKVSFAEYELPYLIILGNVKLSSVEKLDASKLRYIRGNLKVTWCENLDLSSLEKIDGDVDIVDAYSSNLESLKVINGNLKRAARLESKLDNLTKIMGDANFDFCNTENLNNLEEVHGNLYFWFSQKEFDKLRYVKGTINCGGICNVKDFPSLEQCEGFCGIPTEITKKFEYSEEEGISVAKSVKRQNV